jgi:acyl-CoA synthetase (AMP-forming)/AMP-acid ligase II
LIARVVCELPHDKRPKLGYVASAGGVLTSETVKLIREAFPEARIFNQYGLTEASPRVTAVDDQSEAFAKGSVGKPIRDVAIEVWDGDRQCAPGERGEIVVSGPSVMLEYLDDPDGTATVLTARGLRTGDLGYADADGYIYVDGRNDDLVNIAGERTSLHAVADSIRALDGVDDAFVAAVADEQLGTKLVAIVAAEAYRLREIQRATRQALPSAQRPGTWLVVDELPRTDNGKLDRGKMRSWAQAGSAQ